MKTKWYLLGCMTSIALLMLFFAISINSIMKLASKPTAVRIENNSVLHLDLKGQIQEYTEISDMNFSFLPDSAHDIIQKINTAATDSRINAILLEPQGIIASRATVNEIMDALNRFRDSGKRVYGYITMATQADIWLLGAADEVFMNPSASAGFVMIGSGGTIGYYKDLLDKINVTMRVVKAGDYKSAGEPFERSTMSPEFRRNITALFDDIYEQFLIDLARNFDTTVGNFRYVFESRNEYLINLEKGIEYGIVDELLHRDALLRRLNIPEDRLVKHTRYTPDIHRPHANRIAVIYAQGNITPATPQFGQTNINSRQFLRMLDSIEKDNSIRAVVIRIDSGGGSALESEIIHNRIAKLQEIKPVVVSMGGTAASGGYFVAANANYIFADPYTVTGSIGVISMIPDFSDAADNLGINTYDVGHGKFLYTQNTWRIWNRDFENSIQIMTDGIYNEFKTRVSEGRNMSMDEVERIAQGQIWSAKAALQHNLIDEVGGLQDAISKAAEIASIDRYSMVYFPERKTLMAAMMEDSPFNFSVARMLIKKELPEFMSRPVDRGMDLLNDIMVHPVQMRNEFFIQMD
ncbi:MAG: signal peptide peptidase SppA [Candidatus Cloacimonetes bacterium]|nr:signal peptide peptidase SppA [Candidatus Cloacimonadota bacterium]